jgi:hypothetical protein
MMGVLTSPHLRRKPADDEMDIDNTPICLDLNTDDGGIDEPPPSQKPADDEMDVYNTSICLDLNTDDEGIDEPPPSQKPADDETDIDNPVICLDLNTDGEGIVESRIFDTIVVQHVPNPQGRDCLLHRLRCAFGSGAISNSQSIPPSHARDVQATM